MSDSEQVLSVPCGASALMPSVQIQRSDNLPVDSAVSARILKRLFDILAAILLLILAAPTFVLISVLILYCGGTLFYAHYRIGAGGRPFRCLKFRTMVDDADHVLAATLAGDPVARAEWEAKRKLVNDPRVTKIGRVLRRSSLDELPQLINVLRGDMSLVGPRPIVREEETKYGDNLAYYIAVRPGITGLWQISGRSNTSFEQRVMLDRSYVESWTLREDFSILLRTIPALLARDGAY